MIPNLLKDRVQIQVKIVTQGPLGEIVTWTPVASRYARIIPLKAEARAAYQQLNSVVSHKVVFSKGTVSLSLSLGNNRILHGSKVYEPVEPPQTIEGNIVVVVKEI